jgi:beta-1,4-mannosyltransferase
VDCFYPALRASGVEVREGVFAGRWLWTNLRNVDYVHVHWPSFFYSSPRRAECLHGFSIFLFLFALMRWRGARLIWTVHNLQPHDRCIVPQFDRWARSIVVRSAAWFLVHGPSAERAVLDRFPGAAGRTLLIEHGNWIGHFPDTIGRQEARARLALANGDLVFLFIGLCKPYKNLERLIQAFGNLPGRPVLVIAGGFQSADYEARVRAAVEASPARILLKPGFVPSEEMQVYLRACDAVVAPYTEILTSGTAVLAQTFGRPVIAPAIGFLKDLLRDGCGILYNPEATDGLERAMRAMMESRFDESYITSQMARHTWENTASIVYENIAQDPAKR